MVDEPMRQIGEAASRAGLSLRTVRYYEEVGLVVPSGRTEGGFRQYTDADIDRLVFVKQIKPLEFSLEDLRELLEARDRLRDADIGDAERGDLAARLAAFAGTARQRSEELRDRLEQAEAVTEELSEEAHAAGVPSVATPRR